MDVRSHPFPAQFFALESQYKAIIDAGGSVSLDRLVRKPDLVEDAQDRLREKHSRDNDRFVSILRVLDPFQFLIISLAEWMNQRQLQIIDYLREENRVLREQLGSRRLRLNHDQRRRLASKAKGLGRKLLAEVATIVTPETLLAWHRKLIAQKVRRNPQAWTRPTASDRGGGSLGHPNGKREPRLGLSSDSGCAV